MPTTILVADDSLFARMLIKEAVSQLFSSVQFIECTSGQETLDQQATNSDIEWFLLDVNMGEPNGLEAAKGLIKNGVGQDRITLVTGNKSSALQQEADSIGLNYINKAIGPADVEAFVGRLSVFFNITTGEANG